jgi:hypothetical protein
MASSPVHARIGSPSQGLRSSSRQHTNASRPPGRVALARFANAWTGASKNMTPKRE